MIYMIKTRVNSRWKVKSSFFVRNVLIRNTEDEISFEIITKEVKKANIINERFAE